MAANKTTWVNGLDSLRFVLALIVLLSHIHSPVAAAFKHSHNFLLHFAGMFMEHLFSGAAAVSGFFIISGFVIHYPNKQKDTLRVVPFLIRRLIRIGVPMIVIGLIASHYNQFYALPLWSLYCELFYYMLYPLLFRMKWSWNTKLYISYVVCAIFIALLVAVNAGWLPGNKFNGGKGWYWQTSIIFINLPSWLLGVILAEKIDYYKGAVTYGKLWLMRGGALFLAMASIALRMHYQINYTYTLVVFALFFYKWLEAEIIYHRHNPAGKFSEYLGKFSYSLYLCHLLCLPLVERYLPLNVYTYPLYISLPIIMSYVAYLLVEWPAHILAGKIGSKISY